MIEAWKAMLRAIRDVIRWVARQALKPIVKALKALGDLFKTTGELFSEWSVELEKI